MSSDLMSLYFFISLLAVGEPRAADTQLQYAEHLFAQQAYTSAVLEYKRFLFYNPRTDSTDWMRYRIAESFYHQGKLDAAREAFQAFTTTYPSSPRFLHAQLMLGRIHLDSGAYATARSILFQVVNADGDAEVAAQAQYLRGWCYTHERDWLKAVAEFRKVSDFQPNTNLSRISSQLADMTLTRTPLPFKSPQRAQWMSTFVPGLGQIYVGKIARGLAQTAVHTALLYLLVDSILDERYADTIGIGLATSWLYSRTRVRAKRWAIEHNRIVEADFIRQLKGKAEEIEWGLFPPRPENAADSCKRWYRKDSAVP